MGRCEAPACFLLALGIGVVRSSVFLLAKKYRSDSGATQSPTLCVAKGNALIFFSWFNGLCMSSSGV